MKNKGKWFALSIFLSSYILIAVVITIYVPGGGIALFIGTVAALLSIWWTKRQERRKKN